MRTIFQTVSITVLTSFLWASAIQSRSRAVDLFEMGDFSGAARDFTELLKKDPNSPTLRFNLGLAKYYEGDFAEAARQFQSILNLDSDHPSAHFMLGILAKSAGSTLVAVHHFEAVLAIDPEDAATYYQLGQVATLADDNPKAIKYFRESLRRQPANPSTLYNLARTLIRSGETEEGRQMMARFQEIQKALKETMPATMGGPSLLQGRFAKILR